MAAVDLWSNVADSLVSSSVHWFMCTPSDSTDLPYVSREITVGTAGDVVLVKMDGTTETIPSAVWTAAPTQAIRATRIKATDTTADNILVKP